MNYNPIEALFDKKFSWSTSNKERVLEKQGDQQY